MRKDDLMAGLRGKPVAFEVDGFGVHLRPLAASDRVGLLAWYRANRKEPDAAHVLQHKLIALAVIDPDNGGQLLTEADAAALPALAVDVISEEVARRNGLGKDGEDDAGKVSRPTPN
ncbi:MAG TPA: hypothetical protein VD866_03185 [Urbifossiella sp.]|nr:hypothetical protein [Urbifossiella sp.]